MPWLVASLLAVLTAASPAKADTAQAARWHLEEGSRDVQWRQAERRCERAEAEDRADWRLPSADELWDLASQAEDGDAEARRIVAALEGAAAWSRDVSPSNLAWAASFEHGHLFRLHAANERGLRALCVAGPAPDAAVAVDEGSWVRPLGGDSDSALVWPCIGEAREPVAVRGSLAAFRRALPPGPLREVVQVDFVVDEEGRARFVGPAPGTPDRFGRLAVDALETYRFEPATCDGLAVPVFHRLDLRGGDAP